MATGQPTGPSVWDGYAAMVVAAIGIEMVAVIAAVAVDSAS